MPLFYKDLAGKVLGWDRNAERIFGYQPDEIIGRSMDAIIPAERRAEEAAIIDRLNGGDSIEGLETLRVAKDGTLRRVALSIAPVRGNDGKVVAAVKFVRNINSSSIEGSESLLLRAREVEHRAKNILATILSMTRLSQAGTVVELKDVISGRIRALADVTNLTVLLYDKGADIKHIITNEFWSTRNEVASRVSIDGPTIILGADQTQCIAHDRP